MPQEFASENSGHLIWFGRIITRAEMRMADEIDAGQARGVVQHAGGDRKTIVRRGLGKRNPLLANIAPRFGFCGRVRRADGCGWRAKRKI